MKWDRHLKEIGILNNMSPGCTRTSNKDDDSIRQAFVHSPHKSIHKACQQMHLPQSTNHDDVHKSLRLRVYKLQLCQHIKPADHDATKTFYEQMLDKIGNNESFLN
jgi:hypothetical protein